MALLVSISSRFLSTSYKNLTRNALLRIANRRQSSTQNETDAREDFQRMRDEDEEYETGIKLKILDASLAFVPENGWSKNTLVLGAETLGYPGIIHGLFPKGGVELVYHFYQKSNSLLSEQLAQQAEQTENVAAKKKNEIEFLRHAVELRLRMNTDYVLSGRWTEALGLMALPQNASTSLTHLTQLVDDMWYYAGDRSVDFSWYTKRAALAAVYKSTELCMLSDYSTDFEDTWAFLDRRMDQFNQLSKCSQRCKESTAVASGLFQTALNILGLNSNRR